MKKIIVFCYLCVFSLILFSNIALSAPIVTPISTSFDTGFEGWIPTVPSETTWEPAGGNPEGYVRHTDVGANAGEINSPAAYLGDWTNLDGTGSISFDHKLFSTGFIGSAGIADYEIIIFGSGGERAKWTSAGPSGVTGWITLSAPIKESSWLVEVGPWNSLLSSVASLRIRSEMVNNGASVDRDITGIDNILLSVPTTISIDIKPQSCPNPLNVKSKGVLPVAILGTVNFDVRDIDIATLEINGVAPIKTAFEDVTTPSALEPCDCEALGSDTFEDLTLKFDTQAIVATLGSVSKGLEIPLTLTGKLTDGVTEIEGSDCVVIKGLK